MGTMNKLREQTGVILWILVIAFGVIWVLQDSGAFDAIGNTTGQDIIVVDGDPIKYDEYARAVDAQLERYQQQTGESMPPQMVDQERERVYQALVENKLLEHEMDRLGIKVTDEEIYNMVMSETPHPIIKVYFGDGQGNVNRALLQNFINNPEASADWIQIEEYLRNERRREKMENLVSASVRVSPQEVADEYHKRNYRVDAQWVGLRFALLPDDSVQVSESDLKKFYNERREKEFKRKRTYTLNYVTISKQPAPEDSVRVVEELTRLRPRFAEAEDDSVFITRNGAERPYASTWFKASDLDPAVAMAVFKSSMAPGEIVGPFFAGTDAHLIKVQAVRPTEETSVRASHILFRGDDATAQAQQVKDRIASGALTFEQAAGQFGTDGTAQNGGDLGWFGPGAMVAPFEAAAFKAPVGQVIGPVTTDFGQHLIKVTARADREVQIADFTMRVRTDIGTLSKRQEQLEDLRYYAEENGDFEAEAQRLGLQPQQVQVEAGQAFIPGIGNSRNLTNFLGNAEKGALSQIVELDNDFVLAQVQEIAPEGYRPFEEVKAELEPRARNNRKAEVLKGRMQKALQQHGFDGLARAVGTEVMTASDLSFNTTVVPMLGREPKFTGTALGLKEGQTSNVVVGENAVFVLKATDVKEPAPLADAQREQLRTQLRTQRQNQVRSQWLAALRDKADVEDLRRKFQQ